VNSLLPIVGKGGSFARQTHIPGNTRKDGDASQTTRFFGELIMMKLLYRKHPLATPTRLGAHVLLEDSLVGRIPEAFVDAGKVLILVGLS